MQAIAERALSGEDERDLAAGASYVVDSCRVLRACQRLLIAKAGVKPNALPVNLAEAIERCKKHSLITDIEFHELQALRHRANQQRHQTLWALEHERAPAAASHPESEPEPDGGRTLLGDGDALAQRCKRPKTKRRREAGAATVDPREQN